VGACALVGGFLNAQVLNLHELFIGAAIGILPLVIIFLILQRYIVEGLLTVAKKLQLSAVILNYLS
jgi:ABC-type glycerol-3-phosphate transport system permease component